MLIIPAIDIRKGRCVRLIQGDLDRETVYSNDPVEVGREWVRQGAELIHLVDLDGAVEGRPVNIEVIKDIIKAVQGVKTQVGGGIRTTEVVKQLFEHGAHRIVVGTRALESQGWLNELCSTFPGKIAVAIDTRDGNVASNGWKKTQEKSAIHFAKEIQRYDLCSIIVTDINRDGMLEGPNIPLIKKMHEEVNIPIIASGGVSSMDDVKKLCDLKIEGIIIGKALYDGKIRLSEAIQYCKRSK